MPDNDANKMKNQEEQAKINREAENAKNISKTAANAAFGPLGGKAVDLASKTKLGKNALNRAGNAMNKANNLNPMSRLKNNHGLNKPNGLNDSAISDKSNKNKLNNSSDNRGATNPNSQSIKNRIGSGIGGLGKKALSSINPFSRKENIGEEDELENRSAISSIKNSGFVKFIIKYKKIISLLAPSGFVAGCGCSIMFLAVIIVIINIMNPLFAINQLAYNISNKVSSVFGSFIQEMTKVAQCGFVSDEECAQILADKEAKNKEDFYDALQDAYTERLNKYNVRIDLSLLTATLTYYDYYDSALYSDGLTAITNDDGIITGYEDAAGNTVDAPTSYAVDFKKSRNRIDELADQMISDPVITYENESTTDETTGITTTKQVEVKTYSLDLDKYKEYLSTFVRKFYFNNDQSDETTVKVNQAIQDIYDRVDFYNYVMGNGANSYVKVYGYCSGVTIVDDDGNVEDTVGLDDYIAGVVDHENNSGLIESMKAQAIAARTYVLANTNNCSIPIKNSTENQTYSSDPDAMSIQAAEETSGMVMIYNDAVFSAQYDSFCYNDKDCPDATYSNGVYTVTYTKLPAGETHLVTFSDSSNYWRIMNHAGNARGMSQLVANQMAKEGSTYDQILEYFYSDGVQIANMITTLSGTYTSATAIPTSMEEVRERSEIYSDMGTVFLNGKAIDLSLIYSYGSANIGQCVWYAKSRALELIYFSTMPDDEKYNAYMAVANTYANGSGWYDASSLDMFTKTTDYTQPHVGSIVSWSGGNTDCSPACGHVAIVESVDEATGTVVISDGYKTGSWTNKSWDSVVVDGPRTFTFEQLKNYKSDYYTDMNGYVYILG